MNSNQDRENMMKNSLKTPLRGIIPPMITPLLETDKLDLKGVEQLVEHILSGEVHGIFILGTTGEFASLSYKIRNELINLVCKQVCGRVPVLVGITDSSFTESVALAKTAANCGADGLVLAPPYYFTSAQPELLEYLKHIMAQVPLPLFIYNMPIHTKTVFAPDTVKRASDIPGIFGMKDSSANLVYFKEVQHALRHKPDFTFMVGPEELLSEFVLTGGHGGVNGGANMFPKLYVKLYNACVARDFDQIETLQQKVMQISTTIYKVGQYGSSYLKGLKCALSLMGICNDTLAQPFQRFNEPERIKIKNFLDALEYEKLLMN